MSQRSSLLHSDWSPGNEAKQWSGGKGGISRSCKILPVPTYPSIMLNFLSLSTVKVHNYSRKDRGKGKEVKKYEEEGSYDLHFIWGFLLHLLLLFSFQPAYWCQAEDAYLILSHFLFVKYWHIPGSSFQERSTSKNPCAWTQCCFCFDHSSREKGPLSKEANASFSSGKASFWETREQSTGAGQPLLPLILVGTVHVQHISWAKPEWKRAESSSMQHAICYHPSSCKKARIFSAFSTTCVPVDW